MSQAATGHRQRLQANNNKGQIVMPEAHGTDRMHERIEVLEQSRLQHQQELQQLTHNVTSLAASVKEYHEQTIDGMKDMRSEVVKLYTEQRKDLDEIRTRPAPWGVISGYMILALMIGGFFWGEIKLDIVAIDKDLENISKTRWTKQDMKDEIEQIRIREREQDTRIRELEMRG